MISRRSPVSTKTSATFRIVLGVAFVLLGAGPATAAPPPGLDLEPVPVPVLDPLSPADREAVREVRSSLDALLERGDGVEEEVLEEAYGEVGEHYLAHDLMVPAEAALANARSLDPEEFRWPYYLGVLHFREGRLEAAREALEAALELDPDDVPTLLRLGEVHLDQGALDAAEEEFRRALSLNPLSAMAEWGLGRVAQERDRPRQAIERFQRALELQPEASSIHHSLGLAYRDLGDREKAREHFEANRHDPVRFRDPRMERLSRLLRGSRPHIKLGNQAVAKGNLQEARKQFALAVEADPGDRLAHYNLGRVLVQTGSLQEGIEYFRRAVEIDPDYRDAHFNLAAALASRGDWEGAVRHYGRAAEIDPADHRSHLERALALERVGRDDEARSSLEALLEVSPPAPDEIRATAQARLGMAAARAGEGEEAERRLRRAAVLDPGQAPLFAGWLGRQGRFREAAEWYGKAIEAGRDDGEVRFGRAMALLLVGEETEAKATLEEAVAALPEELGLRHALARLLAGARSPEVRDPERALRLAREVFQSRPSIPHAETVAMAHAAAGNFEAAVEWQGRVVGQAGEAPPAVRERARRRLESYRRGEPILAPWQGG